MSKRLTEEEALALAEEIILTMAPDNVSALHLALMQKNSDDLYIEPIAIDPSWSELLYEDPTDENFLSCVLFWQKEARQDIAKALICLHAEKANCHIQWQL